MSEHQIKMVLTSENELQKEVLTQPDPTTCYIILQNRKYQSLLEDLTIENLKLKTQVDEQENEIDSLSRSKTCLQGYVKNEYEYAQNWKFLSVYYDNISVKLFNWSNLVVATYQCCFLMSICINNSTFMKVFAGIFTPISIVYYIREAIKFKQLLKHNKEIIHIHNEISKIEKNNIYIQDLIDNI